MKRPHTAIIHDWLLTPGGAERLLSAIHTLYPSPIFTLLKSSSWDFGESAITTSFLQHLPYALKKHGLYLPFFPLAIEQFDLRGYDLILSSSHSAAKGVITNANQLHICYCHTPMRYAWDLYQDYLEDEGLKSGIRGAFAKLFLHRLRMWDLCSSFRVDHFLANSHFISKRIEKIYRRQAEVIYPPVDTDFFGLEEKKEPFYLTASRLVPYKKIDLIVEVFSSMPDKKLVVIGDGKEKKRILSKAKGNIEYLGSVSDATLRSYLQRAKGFVFASLEDFGILPVEAQSCGTPVIALGQGGTKETVLDGITGTLFNQQTPSSLKEALLKFEKSAFDPKRVREHALLFSKERFNTEFSSYVNRKWEEFLKK